MTISQRFPGSVESVRAARRFVEASVGDVPVAVREALRFLVSELATNSVVHARSDFTVKIEDRGVVVWVEVCDEGDGELELCAPDPSEARGRGLRIVDELSDAWGVQPARPGQGKVVWFAIRTGAGGDRLSWTGA